MAKGKRNYGGLTEEERILFAKEKLLNVGIELFGTKGYHNTNIKELCRTAKISEQVFYEAVKSKDDLLIECYQHSVAIIINKIALGFPTESLSIEDRLRTGIAAFFAALNEDTRLARIIYIEVVGKSAKVEAALQAGFTEFAEFIKLEIDNYTADIPVSDFSITITVRAVLTGLAEISYLHISGEKEIDLEVVGETIATGFAVAADHFGFKLKNASTPNN